ncbi:unnamed protein product [Absidia cylindrospora]
MWAIRSRIRLFKPLISSTQPLRYQRPLTSGIVHQIPPNVITNSSSSNDNGKHDESTTTTVTSKVSSSSTGKFSKKSKRKGRSRKRQLLRTLQQRVGKHMKTSSPVQPLYPDNFRGAPTSVITVDETKMDLDDTWTELDAASTYQRVYPETAIPVATLAHGLDRTLFKSGVHPLRDLASKRHRFTPYLENITQPEDFDYEAIQPYITSSKDKNLMQMAKDQKAQYVGSTSSLSGILSHLYFKISNYRPVDISFLSRGFTNQSKNYTRGCRVPKTILLRWKDGIYGVDADKSFETGNTILSHLGKSMEKVLTLEPKEFERYLKKNSSTVTEEERNAPEAYAYGRINNLFLRSQLDCYHQNLKRRTFDLKTRATMPIRLDIPHYQDYLNYKLEQNHGLHYSFEREYYDMMRSAFLKYSFQVRIGHMDGIMVAYHNTENIFGFQYIKRSEMDARLFGTSKMGDEVFNYSLKLMQTIFDKATTKYPQQTLRMTFDASQSAYNQLRVFIEPVSEEQEKRMDDDYVEKDQDDNLRTVADIKMDDPEFEPLCDQVTLYHVHTTSYLNGKKIEGPVSVNKESDVWDVCYQLEDMESIPNDTRRDFFRRVRYNQATVFLPQSDESPKFLQRFKLERNERRKMKNDDEDKSTESPPTPLETPSTTSSSSTTPSTTSTTNTSSSSTDGQ